MNALVIGYGSIGSRHARILRQMGFDVTVLSSREIDFNPSVRTLGQALKGKKFDYVVVANKTSEHFSALCRLEREGFRGTVLMEKPLYLKANERRFHFKRLLVAYNLRFHPLLLELRRRLKNEKVISAFCYVGKYLPDWHPDKDYRLRYSSIKKFGGGVLRDLSHELDYLAWMLGDWTRVSAIGGRWSRLQMDCDEVFSLLYTAKRCPAVSVQMNYLDRLSRRQLIINTQAHTYKADLIAGTLEIDKDKPKFFFVDRDDTYRAEHGAVKKKQFEKLCSWREALETMRLIEAAEKSSKHKKWVSR